jgi:hypothetical protein
MSTLKLSSQQILKPSLQQGYDSSKEEEPDSETGEVKSVSGTFSDWARVEPVIDDMLEIFASPDLTHETVLVTVHTSELTDVIENIVNTVSQLEGIDVAKSILYMGIED